MSCLFIAGNGFDIAHGIPTKYSDFRSFIIRLYPEALTWRDKTIYLEEYKNIDPHELAAELLLNVMDNAAGINWCNFEDALAYICFNNKFPRVNYNENIIDDDQEIMKNYLLYIDMLQNGFINCSKLWQDLFRLWLKDIQKRIDNNEYSNKTTLKKLLLQSNMQFFTFNYTKTLQKLYGIKKVIHIHNHVGQKLIWGHGEDKPMYEYSMMQSDGPYIGSSFLDDMIMSFKKDTITPLKKYNDFFKKLDHNIDKVFSYGFSYGKVDNVYIKKIVSCISPNAIWHFTKFEAKDKESLRIKKIKLRNYGFSGSFEIYEG